MPETDQKLFDNFSFLISTVVPNLLKKFFTCWSGGQIGTGPFRIEMGGNGMALTILTFLPIAFLSCAKLIVAIKLITFCLVLNFLLLFQEPQCH